MRFRLHVLICGLLMLAGCSNQSSKNESAPSDSTHLNQKHASSTTYTNPRYDISLRRPGNWLLLEEPHLKAGDFAINLFPKDSKAVKHTPLGVHAPGRYSYIAIWPHGLGTELPKGEFVSLDETKHKLNLSFAVDAKKSKALQLKNDVTWAYFIMPQNPPENWTSNGFIFAQIRTPNPSSHCYDKQTNKEINLDQCDVHEGDHFVREGTIDQNQGETIRQILNSITLGEIKEKPSAVDLIDINNPLPNADVQSPLKIVGRAKGSWYFEGVFNVELIDAFGNKLAEGSAKAQGDWTTDNFVPFSVTLTFDAPDDQRGRLIFHRANPSGKPENEMHYSQPVIFPPR